MYSANIRSRERGVMDWHEQVVLNDDLRSAGALSGGLSSFRCQSRCDPQLRPDSTQQRESFNASVVDQRVCGRVHVLWRWRRVPMRVVFQAREMTRRGPHFRTGGRGRYEKLHFRQALDWGINGNNRARDSLETRNRSSCCATRRNTFTFVTVVTLEDKGSR